MMTENNDASWAPGSQVLLFIEQETRTASKTNVHRFLSWMHNLPEIRLLSRLHGRRGSGSEVGEHVSTSVGHVCRGLFIKTKLFFTTRVEPTLKWKPWRRHQQLLPFAGTAFPCHSIQLANLRRGVYAMCQHRISFTCRQSTCNSQRRCWLTKLFPLSRSEWAGQQLMLHRDAISLNQILEIYSNAEVRLCN